MYDNGRGIVGVGKVLDKWDGKEYRNQIYYDREEPEYRIKVDWLLDLRENHIRVEDIKKIVGYQPRGAVRRILKRKKEIASMVNELSTRKIIPPERKVNQAERAFRAWSILTECARSQKSITYGELSQRLGIHHRPIRYVLELIQDYCLNEKLPPLTILVINQNGTPGKGFIAWDIDNLQEGIEKVHSYHWTTSPNPFMYAADGQTDEEIAEILVQDPDKAIDIYARVKIRGVAQGIFRKTLLKAYGNRCAFSGISIPEVLDAVHIVPWSECEPKERLDPRNGLLCTSLHHKLFDTGKIFVTEDYKISINDKLMNRSSSSEIERILITKLHGEKLRLPVSPSLWPSPAIIRRHNKFWQKKELSMTHQTAKVTDEV